MSHRHVATIVLFFSLSLGLLGCESPPDGTASDATVADAGVPDAAAPDATVAGAWALERLADDRAVRKLVARGEGDVPEILVVGSGALADVRAAGALGAWTPLAPESLATVLEPFAVPRGEFVDAAYIASSSTWLVAGGLGFYRGGAVALQANGSGGWRLELDEVRDLGSEELGGGPVTALLIRGNCAFCSTEYLAAFDGKLVHREVTAGGSWATIVVGSDLSVTALTELPLSFGVLRGYGNGIHETTVFAKGWWTALDLPSETDHLFAAWADAGHTVAVGTSGLIVMDDDAQRVGELPFLAIHGTSFADLWAVGLGGAIVHFDGTTWTVVPPPESGLSFSAVLVTPSNVWLGTENGEIWRLAR